MSDTKCAVSWCKLAAEWTWERTPAELRDMYRGKRWQDQQDSWERVRHVCTAHKPRWRNDVYVPFGQSRQVVAPDVKRARKQAPAASPALDALMAELAETREALERERKQSELYRQSWSAHREALELLRQARAELASLRASVEAPADLLAELVA